MSSGKKFLIHSTCSNGKGHHKYFGSTLEKPQIQLTVVWHVVHADCFGRAIFNYFDYEPPSIDFQFYQQNKFAF